MENNDNGLRRLILVRRHEDGNITEYKTQTVERYIAEPEGDNPLESVFGEARFLVHTLDDEMVDIPVKEVVGAYLA